MVTKLIKYDFASYLRLLLPVQIAVLGIAAVNRIVQIFEDTQSVVYRIIFGSSIFLYGVAIGAALLLTTIVAVVRFYQGMYTHEGYLNHTLPVTPTQHIFSKLIVSMLFLFGTLLTIIVSGCIATLGELNIELVKSGSFLLGKVFDEAGWNLPFYIIEYLLMIPVSFATGLLELYFCISVGQLAQKRKILLAVGVYFAMYTASQIIGTICIVIASVNYEWMEEIGKWIEANSFAFIHIVNVGGLMLSLIIGGVFFFIIRHIMSRKLNLT